MIEVKNISLSFEKFALQDISFTIAKGDYYFLLGRSGAGKSLILELLAGLLKPHAGDILYQGKSIVNETFPNKKIVLVFQDNALFPHLSVKKNLAYGLKGLPKEEINQRIEKEAEQFEIAHLLERKPARLSGGEKRRVALARAMVIRPAVLLLDEPMAALDVQLYAEVRQLLRAINQRGTTIVHVSHNPDEASLLAKKIAVFDQGKLVQLGTRHDIFHNPSSSFVAQFSGVKNYYKVTKHTTNSRQVVTEEGFSLLLTIDVPAQKGSIIIPSEAIHLLKYDQSLASPNSFTAIVVDLFPLSKGIEYKMRLEDKLNFYTVVYIPTPEKSMFRVGERISVLINASVVRFVEEC